MKSTDLSFSSPSGNSSLPVGLGWRHPHYGELLERRPDVEFLEVHSENFFGNGGAALAILERGRKYYPISLHGVGLSLGSAEGIDSGHLEQLAELVQRIDPVRISDHASFALGVWSGPEKVRTIHAADLLPIPFSDEALGVLCTNVERVQDRLKRPILVENLSSYLRWAPQPDEVQLCETDFLNTMATRTGCSLLIDVNNIYVNALNAGIHGATGDPVENCLNWLDGIQSNRVAEIHLAGHCHVSALANDGLLNEIFIDDHGSRVCNHVWRIYEYAISRFGKVPTLIEWDTDVPPLDVLLDEVSLARSHALAGLSETACFGKPDGRSASESEHDQ